MKHGERKRRRRAPARRRRERRAVPEDDRLVDPVLEDLMRERLGRGSR